jgi:hypothetical protein
MGKAEREAARRARENGAQEPEHRPADDREADAKTQTEQHDAGDASATEAPEDESPPEAASPTKAMSLKDLVDEHILDLDLKEEVRKRLAGREPLITAMMIAQGGGLIQFGTHGPHFAKARKGGGGHVLAKHNERRHIELK